MAAAPSVLCAFNGLWRAIDDGACGARVFPVGLLDYAGVLLRVHFIFNFYSDYWLRHCRLCPAQRRAQSIGCTGFGLYGVAIDVRDPISRGRR